MVVAVLGSMTLGIVSAQDGLLKGTADKVHSSDTAKREKEDGKPSDPTKALWGSWSKLLIEVTAEDMGMSARELWAEVKDGSTIAGFAEVQGVGVDVMNKW